MTDQNHRRWKAMVRRSRQAQREGQPVVPIDADLLLEVNEFMRGLCHDILIAREEHACPS